MDKGKIGSSFESYQKEERENNKDEIIAMLVSALKECREYSLGTAGDDCYIYKIMDRALDAYDAYTAF